MLAGGALLLLAASGCGDANEEQLAASQAAPEEPKPRWQVAEEEAAAKAAAGEAAEPQKADARTADIADAMNPGSSDVPAQPERPVPPAPQEEPEEPAAPLIPGLGDRPDDVVKWKRQDYLDALADDDPRLREAVVRFGKEMAGDEEAAKLVTQLLEESPSLFAKNKKRTRTDDEDEDEREEAQVNLELGQALVGAFAQNGTAPGRKTLEWVLQGKIKTIFEDRTLVEAALAALAARITRQNEDVLYTVLTAPDKVRPPNRGQVSARDLQWECLQALRDVPCPRLRTMVARYMVRPTTTEEERQALGVLVHPHTIDNLEAHVLLYASQALKPDHKDALRQLFMTYGVTTMGHLLDIPPNRYRNDYRIDAWADRPWHTADSYRMARAMWGPVFVESIATQVAGVTDVSLDEDFLRLAMSLPAHPVRVRLAGVLGHQWLEAAPSFEQRSLESQTLADPGLILVLKSLPREEDPKRRKTRPEEDDEENEERPTNPVKLAAMERLKKERTARYAWMSVTEHFLESLNSRFLAAALSRVERSKEQYLTGTTAEEVPRQTSEDDPFGTASLPAGDLVRPDEEPVPDEAPLPLEGGGQLEFAPGPAPVREFPFPLQKGAELKAEYHLSWPEDLGGQVPDIQITPLIIHYGRMEVEDRISRVVSHYVRHVKGAEDRFRERGRWVDALQKVPETDHARSVDVLITRFAEEPPVTRDATEKLVVEVLVIEAPDPAPARPAAVTAAGS